MKLLNAMSVILTEACNLSCSYCYEKRKSPETMTLETAKAAVDFLAEHREEGSRNSIMWFGGEPLLNLDVLEQIVPYTAEKLPKCDQLVITNGTLMSDRILALFTNNPSLRLQLSWDGMPKYQDATRGKSAEFEANIPAWNTLRCTTDIHVQIVPDMLPGLFENVMYIHGKFPRAKIVLRPIGEADGWTDEKVNQLYAESHALYRELGEVIDKVANCESAIASEGTCVAGKNFAAIAPSGDMYACHRFYFGANREFKVGSLSEGFLENSRTEILEDYTKRNIVGCEECEAFENCERCIAANYGETGDVLLPKPESCKVHCGMFKALFHYIRAVRPWMVTIPEGAFAPMKLPKLRDPRKLLPFMNDEVVQRLADYEALIRRLEYRITVLEQRAEFEANRRKGVPNK